MRLVQRAMRRSGAVPASVLKQASSEEDCAIVVEGAAAARNKLSSKAPRTAHPLSGIPASKRRMPIILSHIDNGSVQDGLVPGRFDTIETFLPRSYPSHFPNCI